MPWKCCNQYASKIRKFSDGHRTGKGQFSFQSKERQWQRMFKLLHKCAHSHTNKMMLKILKARFQYNMNWELPDVQAGFRKGRGTKDQILNICWIIQKKKTRERERIPEKYLLLFHWPLLRPLTVWITTNWKILKEMGILNHLTCLLRNLYTGQETTVKMTWNNKLVQNWERSMSRLYIVTLLIYLICRVHNGKFWTGWIPSWNQDCWEKYQ